MPDRARNRTVLAAATFVLVIAANSPAQSIAVLDPERSDISTSVARSFSESAGRGTKVLDRDLADAAFRSFRLESPFNLDTETARAVGAAIGCRYFVLVRTGMNRRSARGRESYSEAHAAYYLVNSSTGRLVHWEISTVERESESDAAEDLLATVPETASVMLSKIPSASSSGESIFSEFSEAPEASETERPPMPFRRLSPELPGIAFIHGIAATIDIEVAVDSEGNVAGTRILRWAGYGLDEAVDSAVRTMQWRPGERNGRFLPMRVLLRYNFREIKNED